MQTRRELFRRAAVREPYAGGAAAETNPTGANPTRVGP